MDWNQLITALVVGVPAAFWKWLDRRDARSELNTKMEQAVETVGKLTAAIESKNSELDETEDELHSTRGELHLTRDELHATRQELYLVKEKLQLLESERDNS